MRATSLLAVSLLASSAVAGKEEPLAPLPVRVAGQHEAEGQLDAALSSIQAAFDVAKDSVVDYLEDVSWNKAVEGIKTALALAHGKAEEHFGGSEGPLAEYYARVNWTYIEDEAGKALSLALDCKEVAAVMAAEKGEEGVHLTKRQIKFIATNFIHAYKSVNFTAIEEFLQKAIELSTAKVRVAQDKTSEALSAAGGAAADVQGKAAFAFGDTDADGQINLLDASALAAAPAARSASASHGASTAVAAVGLGALVLAIVAVRRARATVAYAMAKAEGGEPAQPMI